MKWPILLLTMAPVERPASVVSDVPDLGPLTIPAACRVTATGEPCYAPVTGVPEIVAANLESARVALQRARAALAASEVAQAEREALALCREAS